MINGSKGILGVLIACATAGIIIGVVTKTGVGLKMATALLDLAGGHLMPAMVFTMLTSLILGMGVPTTANYVITSTIAAPALIQMDVPVLAAHMFVFYFGIVADITPPVALAAYAGSGISGGDPLRTGINASKLAIAAFIIPYIFVLSPEILMINATPFGVVFSCCTANFWAWLALLRQWARTLPAILASAALPVLLRRPRPYRPGPVYRRCRCCFNGNRLSVEP